jgi:hypothetical protein
LRFGIFYEHQNLRPWREERSEHRLLKDALEQVELADSVGFDCHVLTHHENGKPPTRWTIRVEGDAARLLRGVNASPAITFRLPVPTGRA